MRCAVRDLQFFRFILLEIKIELKKKGKTQNGHYIAHITRVWFGFVWLEDGSVCGNREAPSIDVRDVNGRSMFVITHLSSFDSWYVRSLLAKRLIQSTKFGLLDPAFLFVDFFIEIRLGSSIVVVGSKYHLLLVLDLALDLLNRTEDAMCGLSYYIIA